MVDAKQRKPLYVGIIITACRKGKRKKEVTFSSTLVLSIDFACCHEPTAEPWSN